MNEKQNTATWGSEKTKKDGVLRIWFGRGDTRWFTLIETGLALEVEMADARISIDDYAERPMLSAMIAAFTANRHAGGFESLAEHKWDVLHLRDAACRAWEENIAVEEAKGQMPDEPLFGRCLLHLALLWANTYGPKRTN
jgi:hypothetical protein